MIMRDEVLNNHKMPVSPFGGTGIFYFEDAMRTVRTEKALGLRAHEYTKYANNRGNYVAELMSMRSRRITEVTMLPSSRNCEAVE